MKIDVITRACLLGAWLVVSPALSADEEAPPADQAARGKAASRSMTFGWPFVDPEKMKVRGGLTTGTAVTLDPKPSPAWRRLREDGLAPEDQDRRAILAMAGSYRVSFQFVETMGFAGNYSPPRPYFSWGTEEVRVLEDSANLISLQHTLVMYFDDEDGKEAEPMVMKHWRQDWRYQDGDLHPYRGDQRWRRSTLREEAVEGRWTQAVYQVDDSPRYEAIGKWTHHGGTSTWTSWNAWRPLPRREFSVRDDYNVLDGSHYIAITPTGWVHTQHNRKLRVANGNSPACLAQELGINRYERISAPDLETPANRYYAQTGAYWKEVRTMWDEIYRTHDEFRLKASYEDMKLYEHHFGYAARIADEQDYRPEDGRRHARETITQFLELKKEDRRKHRGN